MEQVKMEEYLTEQVNLFELFEVFCSQRVMEWEKAT